MKEKTRLICLLSIAISGIIALTWGLTLTRSIHRSVPDFQNVYYGTACFIHSCDPYNAQRLDAFYKQQGYVDPTETANLYQLRTLYINIPTTFFFIAPFTVLPWGPAHIAWIVLVTLSFFLASILMWNIGARYSPVLATVLVSIVLIGSEILFMTGNNAGIIVSLCIIATWCLLEEKFILLGMLCFVPALAIKPHDAGLIWLSFLFAGAAYRKRALQSFIIVTILGLGALLWVSHVVPHWLPEIRANMATISGPQGINNPGPGSLSGNTPVMVVNLQAAISLFRNQPHFYNLISYLICGTMLLFWLRTTLRSPSSITKQWFSIAAIVPITLLVTYHRPYDTKLLLLCIPACTMLWSKGGSRGKTAAILTTAATLLTGDLPLSLLLILHNHIAPYTAGLPKLLLSVLLTRPASLILLALAIFYLWAYSQLPSIGSFEPVAADPVPPRITVSDPVISAH